MNRGRSRFRPGKKGIWRAVLAGMVLLVLLKAWCRVIFPRVSEKMMPEFSEMAKTAGQSVLRHMWERFYPAPDFSGGQDKKEDKENDPSYRAAREAETFFREHEYLEVYGNEETWETGQGEKFLAGNDGQSVGQEGKDGSRGNERGSGELGQSGGSSAPGQDGKGGISGRDEGNSNPGQSGGSGISGRGEGSSIPGRTGESGVSGQTGESSAPGQTGEEGAAAMSRASNPGQRYRLAQLYDYDFLMSHFYNVHTSTTADRQLMNTEKLLKKNFCLYPEGENLREGPQILIYHTHSQESFSDSKEGESIVEVGTYLAGLLERKGFSVYHDRSVYDVREGKLDRNRAYTYALEGISRILEENPSIQVVIDLHRDGVKEGTRLVTEVNGKPAAQIMFFNGLSQTPDGPVPYLENPNREDNLAFSLQLQLKANAYYPGFARKIYLKGLRYNQHVRPCSCLVEVGAQTNTYEEARNAMEPLAEVFTMVLRGN